MDESVLFYSNKCKHSKDFLEKLKQYKDIDNSLMKICIDNKPINTLPKYIKSVPTLVYNRNKLTSGTGVFEWLKSQKNTNVQNTEEISPYHANEMGTMFSDSFSFLDSDDTKEGQPISHNFEFLGSTFSISTPEENGANNSVSSSSNKGRGSSEYDKLLQQRDSESFAQPINRI